MHRTLGFATFKPAGMTSLNPVLWGSETDRRYQYYWGGHQPNSARTFATGAWVDLQGTYRSTGAPLQGTDKHEFTPFSSAFVNAGQLRTVDAHIQALVEKGVLEVSSDGQKVRLTKSYRK